MKASAMYDEKELSAKLCGGGNDKLSGISHRKRAQLAAAEEVDVLADVTAGQMRACVCNA